MSIGLLGLGLAVGLLAAAICLILGQPPWMALLLYSAAGSLAILAGALLVAHRGRQCERARGTVAPLLLRAPDGPAPAKDQAGRASRARPAIALNASGS